MSMAVADLLHTWTDRTARGARDEILRDHGRDAVIFDVLPPLCHGGMTASRATWDDWQPKTRDPFTFPLEDPQVTEHVDLACAHGLLRCRGTTVEGHSFQDLVRATFCLARQDGHWRITHQHISAPR